MGWRGEPGVHDEPQHVYQGEITRELLDCLAVKNYVIEKGTTQEELAGYFAEISEEFEKGHQCALVIKKGSLETELKMKYQNVYPMSREEVVNLFIDAMKEDDIVVSTTGKLSRELFEAREARNQGHERDFLTVGSMGHSSMIAMGIAMNKKDRRVFCLVHVLFNNGAHETVGGLPTVSSHVDYLKIAEACGYENIFTAADKEELQEVFGKLDQAKGSVFIEVKTNLTSRADLGRPTTTPVQNKEAFMNFLK